MVLLYLVWWVFTFSWWGSAGVCSSASVSLHAAGAAPAAPASSAGSHAPWRAAGVWAWLANATATPLCGALPSDTSRIHTCCTPARPVRLKQARSLWSIRTQRPTVLFEAALCIWARLWCLWFGAVAAAASVAGPTVVRLPRFPVRDFLSLWNHYNVVLRSTSTVMRFLN